MPSDLIYREDAKDYARHAIAKGLNVLEYLDEVPAADSRPVVRGKWEYISYMTVRCSNCKDIFNELGCVNYCPNCGADMRPQPPKEERA